MQKLHMLTLYKDGAQNQFLLILSKIYLRNENHQKIQYEGNYTNKLMRIYYHHL